MHETVHNAAVGALAPADCDFCVEFRHGPPHGVRKHLGHSIHSRVLDREGRYVAIPTLGQLFVGSILVLPLPHYETTADAVIDAGSSDLRTLIERVRGTVATQGQPLIFEHGARSITDGSCGIYHAHIHVVPVPEHVTVGEVLGNRATSGVDLLSALEFLASRDQYLLVRDTFDRTGFVVIDGTTAQSYPSQYVRRYLARRFQTLSPWDWRYAPQPEPALGATLSWYPDAVTDAAVS